MLKIDAAFGHIRRLVVSVRGSAVTELILCCFKGIFKTISVMVLCFLKQADNPNSCDRFPCVKISG